MTSQRLTAAVLIGSVLVGFAVVGAPVVAAAAVAAVVLVALVVNGQSNLAIAALPLSVMLPPTLRATVLGFPITPYRLALAAAVFAVVATGRRRRMPRAFVVLASLFVLYTFASAFLTGHPDGINRAVTYSLESFAIAWVAFCVTRSIDDARWFLGLLRLAISVAALLALFEVVKGTHLIAGNGSTFFTQAARGGRLRAQGTFPHPIVMGTAAAMLLVASLYTYRRKAGPLAALGVLAAGLYVTFSRGPLVGAAVGVLASTLLLSGARRVRSVVIIAVLVGVVAVMPFGRPLRDLAASIFAPDEYRQLSGYTQDYRADLIDQSLATARERPFGVGAGGESSIRLLTSIGGNTTDLAQSIDNAYAKYLIQFGWPGLAIFLLLVGYCTKAGIMAARRQRGSTDGPLLAGLAGALVAMLVISTTVATFTWAQLAVVYWIIAGVTLALASPSPEVPTLRDRREDALVL